MTRTALLSIALLFASLAHAKPTPEEVKKVIDYYYNGQEQGVLLADLKLCDEVYTKGDQKNECMAERTGDSLKAGERSVVWMMFMVPSGLEPQNVMLQLNYRGMTMSVKRARLTSAIRYRTWEIIKPDRAGEWTLKVFLDKGEEVDLIKELTLNVVEPQPE